MLYLCTIKLNISIMTTTSKQPKQTVKILGQTVTVGTKIHAKLVQQVKQFNDLLKSETNN